MARSALYSGLTVLLLLAVAILLLSGPQGLHQVDAKRQLTAVLGLTDLALCSEARYTRHLSQADVFAPFQDYPGSFEHFPTGSLIVPSVLGMEQRVRLFKHSVEP